MEDMSMLVDAFMDDDMSDSEPSGSAPLGGTGPGAAANAIDALPGLPDSGLIASGGAASSKPEWMSSKMKIVSNSNTIHWGPTIR